MPGDSLEQLLVKKYGVPQEQARNYAAQIISGQAGGHGDALKSEALERTATVEEQRMNEMAEIAEIIMRKQAGEQLPPEYTALLEEKTADSADQTWQNAMAAPAPSPIGPATVTPNQRPNIAIDYAPPPQMPHNAMRNPSRTMGVDTLDSLEVPNPYAERLRRATLARQAMLGN
jgi:hypothetical protein